MVLLVLAVPMSSSAAPVQQAMATKQQQLAQSSFAMAFAAGGEQEDKLVLCIECSRNYEREASVVKAEADAEGPLVGLPGWLVPNKPSADQTPHKDKYLIELKWKWSRLCRKLHPYSSHTDPCSAPCFAAGLAASPSPWWSSSCLLPGSQSKPSIAGFLGLEELMEHGKSRNQWSPPSPSPRRGLSSLREPGCQDVRTALALGSLPRSDSATSDGRALGNDGSAHELERRLRKNVPWQPGAVAEIVEAIAGCRSYGRKGVWLFLKGSDHAAKRRAAMVIAQTHCCSADQIISADPKFRCAEDFCSDVVSRACKIGGKKFVLVVDDVEHAPEDVVDCLVAASKSCSFKDKFGQELDLSESIVILTTSEFANGVTNVISLRLWTLEESSSGDLKRKTDIEPPPRECKRTRHSSGNGLFLGLDLDLNLCAEDIGDNTDDEEAVPSDITHESDTSEHGHPHHLLESVATRVITLDESSDGDHRAAAAIRARLIRALDREVRVDDEAAEALAAASGHFLDDVLERWVAEVFEPASAKVKNGGKTAVLGVGPAGGAQESGFMGSVLPSRVHVD